MPSVTAQTSGLVTQTGLSHLGSHWTGKGDICGYMSMYRDGLKSGSQVAIIFQAS